MLQLLCVGPFKHVSPQQCNVRTIFDQQHTHLSVELWTDVLLYSPDLMVSGLQNMQVCIPWHPADASPPLM